MPNINNMSIMPKTEKNPGARFMGACTWTNYDCPVCQLLLGSLLQWSCSLPTLCNSLTDTEERKEAFRQHICCLAGVGQGRIIFVASHRTYTRKTCACSANDNVVATVAVARPLARYVRAVRGDGMHAYCILTVWTRSQYLAGEKCINFHRCDIRK